MFGKGKDEETETVVTEAKSKEKGFGSKMMDFSEEAITKVREYIKDKDKLKRLIRDAEEKSEQAKNKKGFVQDTLDNLKSMFELVKAYIKGDYRNIPYRSLIVIIGAILYFVMPADSIPDVLVGLGFTDDAAVIAFALKQVKEDLDKFIVWKNTQESMEEEGLTE
ncbi:YkvA family protein [Bacillus sp. V5-8f]|uniref:YkvA family protein n=1 Tax=Bacillus sp. V5-8f TaxID=2053044 RepID=UPI000C7743C2|nr:YkvA family protein [Bacillus sp. V5-8f]PLT35166.1 methyltransferase type 11 [Bacillus sp. V5-8f]